MATSNTTSPATHPDSTPEERCLRYRRDYRLPTTVDPASRQILLTIGGLVGAVTMPTELGRRVLAGLHVRMLTGPVVEHPHAQRWTFLTGPGHTPTETVNADLLRLQISVAHPGDNAAKLVSWLVSGVQRVVVGADRLCGISRKKWIFIGR